MLTGFGSGWADLAGPLGRVRPRATHAAGPPACGLLLQLGDNPTTDYYLRPRLAATGLPWRIADLGAPPAEALDGLPDGPLWVILCRYASGPWLEALERMRPRLSRVSLMIDDDLRAMAFDPALPRRYRAHVFAHHGRLTSRLSRLICETWASTGALAERYGAVAVIDPVPESDPPAPVPAPPPLVVYPGGASHAREAGFVRAVAARVGALRPEARFEMTGDPTTAPVANLDLVAERSWPAYRQAQAGRSAALVLAPLLPSVVNAARAPVKLFDAARLGAAGLFADAAPFRGFVRDGEDGLLLPMRVEAWAQAVVALLDNPTRRLSLAVRAAERLTDLRRAPSALPGPRR